MSRIMNVTLSSVLFAAGLSVMTSCTVAEEIKVGAKAPDWSGIIGIDDKEHALADYAKAKIVVLVFICNHCPVAVAYEDRLVALQRDYKDKGVQVVAVNVNNLPADRLDQMKIRAKEKGFNFPYLYDPSQKIARDYGAAVTPHVFVLARDRKVAYVGAIDDNIKEKEVKQHYLRDALDALLAGKTPPVPHTKAFGCSIKYE
ncbi:MAG: thioredoxin family protein [Thermogutta sp.]|nr:thioredoxin family protein [Thermogutta sp.]